MTSLLILHNLLITSNSINTKILCIKRTMQKVKSKPKHEIEVEAPIVDTPINETVAVNAPAIPANDESKESVVQRLYGNFEKLFESKLKYRKDPIVNPNPINADIAETNVNESSAVTEAIIQEPSVNATVSHPGATVITHNPTAPLQTDNAPVQTVLQTEDEINQSLAHGLYLNFKKMFGARIKHKLIPDDAAVEDAVRETREKYEEYVIPGIEKGAQLLGINIQKGEEMTKVYANLLQKYKEFIAWIKSWSRFQKAAATCVSVSLFVYFLYKVGVLQQLPKLATKAISSMTNLASDVDVSSASVNTSNIPKPKVLENAGENIVQKGWDYAIEHPYISGCVGGFILGALFMGKGRQLVGKGSQLMVNYLTRQK